MNGFGRGEVRQGGKTRRPGKIGGNFGLIAIDRL